MNLYSIDVRLYGTLYIKADTPEEALEIAKGQKDVALELQEDDCCEIPIDGSEYKNLRVGISLSPAMTVHGPEVGDKPALVESDLPTHDEDEEDAE